MISVKKNFLFVHMPKTGGNSLQTILRRYSEDERIVREWQDGTNRFAIENTLYGTKKHSTLSEYKAVLPPVLYDSLFKFAVIRNPWERMVSMYFSSNQRDWNRETFKKLAEKTLSLRRFIVLDSPIQNVLKKLKFRHEHDGKPHLGIDLESISRRVKFPVDSSKKKLTDDIDYLLRFEILNKEFKLLCKQLDIPHVPLPRVNVSERKHYTQYYDEELKQLVGRKFTEEIEFGKYQFGDTDKG